MCSPTLVILGVAALATTAVTVTAQVQQAKQAEDIAERQALLKNRAATQIERESVVAIEATHRRRAHLIGIARAKSSSLQRAGSTLDLEVEITGYSALDVATIEYNARIKADLLRAGADIDLYQGDAAAAALRGSAIGTALAGVAQAASIGGGTFGETTTPPGRTGGFVVPSGQATAQPFLNPRSLGQITTGA